MPAPRRLLATAVSIIACAALGAGPAAASQSSATPAPAHAAGHRASAACARKSSAHAPRRAAHACRSSARRPRVRRSAKPRPVKPRSVRTRPERTRPAKSHTPAPAATSEPSSAAAQQSSAARDAATIAAVLATPCENTELTPEAANIGLVRAAVLCLINRKRAENDESPLKISPELEQAAEGHCEELIADDYFAHVSPSGETPVDRIRDTGYIPGPNVGYVIGENLAWGTYQLSTPQSIVSAWIASPGHLANILEAQYPKRESASRPPCPHPSPPARPAPPTRRSSASSSMSRAQSAAARMSSPFANLAGPEKGGGPNVE